MMGLVINSVKADALHSVVEIIGVFNETQFRVRTEIGRDREIYYGSGFTYQVNDEFLSTDRFKNTFFNRYESYLYFEDELVDKVNEYLESDEMKKIFPTFDDVESLMFEKEFKFVQNKSLHANKITLYKRVSNNHSGYFERYIDIVRKDGVNQNKAIIGTIEKYSEEESALQITELEAAQLCSENGYRLVAGEETDYRSFWGLYTFDCSGEKHLVSQFETLLEVISYVSRHPCKR